MARGVPHVLVRDVPEDAAEEDEVGRHRARERGGDGGVALHELDGGEPEGRGRGAPRADCLGREVDEARPDVAGPRVVGEHAEEVAAVARAQADDPDRARGRAVERGADRGAHVFEAARLVRVPVVAAVELEPLVRRRTSGPNAGHVKYRGP